MNPNSETLYKVTGVYHSKIKMSWKNTVSDLKQIKEMWQLTETQSSRLDPGLNQEKKKPYKGHYRDNWWEI